MSDLQTFKDFLVLTRLRSFTRAAEKCHVTTSGLSRRIQNLETWLGAPLFDRSKAQLELTAAGELLRDAAADAVATLESVRTAVRKRADTEQSQIRMAAPHVMSSVFFPRWLPRLHSQFGQARFNVMSAVLPECLAALAQGEVDFVVTFVDADGAIAKRMQDTTFSIAEWLDLEQERLIPVSVPSVRGVAMHALGSSPSVAYLDYSRECSLGWALQEAQQHMPGLPSFTAEHGSSLAESIRLMALTGFGLAWLPETLVREDLSTKRLVRAATEAYDVTLSIRILRRSVALGQRAEELWEALRSTEARSLAPSRDAALKVA
ncbi:MAG: Transcriptional regulator, LysR family [Rhodoferax sp.]|nr:Transcriptional regulator, LysR family [Rhodoferax sp.]